MEITFVNDCKIIDLKKIINDKGNLTPVENSTDIPFDVKRIYYLYDVPGGETRGGHAHQKLQQFVICLSGSFDILLDDGTNKKTYKLNRSHYGLFIPPMIWRELVNFSTGAICLVLASEFYEENEYLRDYDEYVKTKYQIKNAI